MVWSEPYRHISEDIRLRGLYRRLALEGKIMLPYWSLKGLIGPDCAYHLYKFDRHINSSIMVKSTGDADMARITTYRCNQCGTRVVVTEKLESHLSPLYCCGMEVAEISSVTKKAVKKKTAKKKKIAPKKKAKKK